MPEPQTITKNNLHFRAAVPAYARYAAVGLLAVAVIVIVVGFLRNSGDPDFRMKGFPTSLSKDVLATVENYERRETEGDRVKYFVRADRAVTFSDNHQELENVYMQVFDPTGERSDEIRAIKAVYVPEQNKNFTAYFAGDVNIATRDSLKVSTQNLTYTHANETAKAEEAVSFDRFNVKGTSVGAVVDVANKRVELLQAVKIETTSDRSGDAAVKIPATMSADYAAYDQAQEKIEMRGSIHVVSGSLEGNAEGAEIRSGRADVYLTAQSETDLTVNRVELFDAVDIKTKQTGGRNSAVTAGYAMYKPEAQYFELKGSANIVTVQGERPTLASGENAAYDQRAGKVSLNGGAEVSQGGELVRGDSLNADLYPTNRVKTASARGNAYLKQQTAERITEVSGEELNARFSENEILAAANVRRNANAVLTPLQRGDYSKVRMSTPIAIAVGFKGTGLLDSVKTDGRTTINLEAREATSNAANKTLTADSVQTGFDGEGKFLASASAVGNAELNVIPLAAGTDQYRTDINAPRFDCDFFPASNNARLCTAATNARAKRIPTVKADGKGEQNITARKIVATFDQATKDVQNIDAEGSAKFVELDRYATADRFSFTMSDSVVRLRGNPLAWDSQARAKATEIDWDTKNQRSQLRGSVSTTYYSQKQTKGTTPFTKVDRPVFLTAERTDLDHAAQAAVYTGNARAWQDDNYVRGNTITIRQPQGELIAEGSVQSSLADAKARDGNGAAKVPVFASSQRMVYNRDSRTLRYETAVDIRQGSDRLTGAVANIFMNDRNELVRTDVENDVTITQPGRTAMGSYASYLAADESVVLRGNPARINDERNGSSQGAEVRIFLRENRVEGQGSSQKDPSGRVRSVIKFKNN
ncbi:MAG: LPS export ABC transporter periplasmic protein LptC [Pyrinomonadaceae bacterium]|nr:LPS export ABC transporter periplasmic protein LptC [Pyrinomonadaceae bacterium]